MSPAVLALGMILTLGASSLVLLLAWSIYKDARASEGRAVASRVAAREQRDSARRMLAAARDLHGRTAENLATAKRLLDEVQP